MSVTYDLPIKDALKIFFDGKNEGCSEEELSACESRLGIALPGELRSFYAEYGKTAMIHEEIGFSALDGLEVSGEYLRFAKSGELFYKLGSGELFRADEKGGFASADMDFEDELFGAFVGMSSIAPYTVTYDDSSPIEAVLDYDGFDAAAIHGFPGEVLISYNPDAEVMVLTIDDKQDGFVKLLAYNIGTDRYLHTEKYDDTCLRASRAVREGVIEGAESTSEAVERLKEDGDGWALSVLYKIVLAGTDDKEALSGAYPELAELIGTVGFINPVLTADFFFEFAYFVLENENDWRKAAEIILANSVEILEKYMPCDYVHIGLAYMHLGKMFESGGEFKIAADAYKNAVMNFTRDPEKLHELLGFVVGKLDEMENKSV